jgi:hypothetical protein
MLSATLVAAAAGLLKPVPGACMHMQGAQYMQNPYAAGTANFREPTKGICIHTCIAVWHCSKLVKRCLPCTILLLPTDGPIGSVIGAAAGGLAGAVAGGTVASQRGPEGAAIDMSKVPANAGEAVASGLPMHAFRLMLQLN